MSSLPILIVGGGIVGLTLAQALKKAGIPFQVFERDAAPDASAGGWGITVHWALPALQSCLPDDLFAQLQDIQVDPQQGIKDTSRFLFLDLATADPVYVIPPSKRLRLDRRKMRQLLCTGIDVQWAKAFSRFETAADGSVVAHFDDGTTARGALIVGADGSNSLVRHRLFDDAAAADLCQLPVRFLGVTVRMTAAQVKPLRDIDPLLFQGCHPDTGVYLWFSMLSTPAVNGSSGSGSDGGSDGGYYEGQINMSWKPAGPEDDVPATDAARLAKMKAMARGFAPVLSKAIGDIPAGTRVVEVRLQDWTPRAWDSRGGTVTLAGDAAHAMTMYRGEAFNHGITDAAQLSEQLAAAWASGGASYRGAVDAYAEDLVERTGAAVLLSRQACLDAHDLKSLSPDSPVVSRRAKVLTADDAGVAAKAAR